MNRADDEYARAIMAAADGADAAGRSSRMPSTIGRPKPAPVEPHRPSVAKFGGGEGAAIGRRAEERSLAVERPARPAPPPAPEPAFVSHKAITFVLEGPIFSRLQMVARENDVMPGRLARTIVEDALKGTAPPPTRPEPMVELTGKPLVRAAVLAAANEAGADLHVFCSKLIDLGLECWLEGGAE